MKTSKTINAPHEVKDTDLLESMIKTLESGGSLPAVCVYWDDDYYFAVTGSHRIAAWKVYADRHNYGEAEYDIVTISETDMAEALEEVNADSLQDVSQFADLAEAIYDVTDDAELRAALEDQF